MKDQTHLMSQPKGDDTWMQKTGGFARDMTLRDEFAGRAMQGMLAANPRTIKKFPIPTPLLVADAYIIADAMLAEREAK